MNKKIENLNPVEVTLLSSQVDVILRALEIYGHNLEYMLSFKEVSTERKSTELAKLKYTFEQLQSAKANQVAQNSVFDDNNLDFIGNLLKNAEKPGNSKLKAL